MAVPRTSRWLSVFAGVALLSSWAGAQTYETPSGPRLKTLGTRDHLLIGSASDLNHNDPNERAIVENEYNILTDEACLKPRATEPARNTFDFAETDQWVGFCLDHHVLPKGHVLIARDHYLPPWMLDKSLTPSDMHEILVHHITQVMGRYKKGSPYGRIQYWDVLNEVIGVPTVFDKIGKDENGDFLYIEQAFKTAHAVDPSCVLIWNEDNLEINPAKAEKLYETIKRLKAKGVPIDAVGFQCHIGYHGHPVPDYDYLAKIFQKFADLGLRIVISEMDVPDRLNQTDIYTHILRVCLAQPKCIIWETWNVVDKYSWRKGTEKGLTLFDDNDHAKPAYYAVQAALENAPAR